MKICQTLWCNNYNLLKDPFGWYSPFYHLIGWTYSCLKLKEHYPEVELYTDSQGKYILIDLLHLPYDKAYVEYDNLKYAPTLWAFPKILTYNKQNEPFLHVDGDIFVFESFSDDLLKSALISQNLEISTSYYNTLFEPLIRNLTYIPEYFKNNLLTRFPKSCNAGILGGTNIDVLKEYSTEAIKFVDKNFFCHSNGNFNMIFEQLLFYTIAKKNRVAIGCYYKEIFKDNGYERKKIADLLETPEMNYIHLIGPLKRDSILCEQLAKKLLTEYPSYFEKIVALFTDSKSKPEFGRNTETIQVEKKPNKKKFFYNRTKTLTDRFYPNNGLNSNKALFDFIKRSNNPYLNETFKYEKWVHSIINKKFKRINYPDLLLIENKIAKSMEYILLLSTNPGKYKLCINPYMELREFAFDIIDFNPYKYLNSESEESKKVIICVPTLLPPKYKEVKVNQTNLNMLSILYNDPNPTGYNIFKEKIMQLIILESSTSTIENCILISLRYLIAGNLIYIEEL